MVARVRLRGRGCVQGTRLLGIFIYNKRACCAPLAEIEEYGPNMNLALQSTWDVLAACQEENAYLAQTLYSLEMMQLFTDGKRPGGRLVSTQVTRAGDDKPCCVLTAVNGLRSAVWGEATEIYFYAQQGYPSWVIMIERKSGDAERA